MNNKSHNQSPLILFVLSISVASVVLPTRAEECVLKSRVSDFPPQYYKSEFGEWHGMGVELAKALLEGTGCRLEFVEGPWFRSLLEMKNGSLDIMMNLSITEERKSFMHFIGPMRDETILLATDSESDVNFHDMEDFMQFEKPVGILKGAFYGESFQDKFDSDDAFKDKFSLIAKNELMLQMLNKGRLSGLLEDKYSLIWLKRNQASPSNLKIHPHPVNKGWVYFGLSKKSVNGKLLIQLNNSYREAKQQGKFEKVIKRYSTY